MSCGQVAPRTLILLVFEDDIDVGFDCDVP